MSDAYRTRAARLCESLGRDSRSPSSRTGGVRHRRPAAGQRVARRASGCEAAARFLDPFRNDLCDGFQSLCGYAAMFDPTGGTVDHYLSYRNHPELAYEWSNYRFASSTMNAIKRDADEAVLDPHEIGVGWFEIILPSLQMRVTARVPPESRERAEATLSRLKLQDDERIIRWRQSWYDMYRAGELTLEGLERVAPLIADAVRNDAAMSNG